MQITFMRHGKPHLAKSGWVAPFEMEQWIAQYNRSEVASTGIPAACVQAVKSASVIVASTAPRALSSVKALGHDASTVDAIFLEADLPFALWRLPKLPPQLWATFFRLLWMVGYSRGAVPAQAARARAKVAARQLVSLARIGPVVLVGHGIMNRLIARELRVAGWVAHTKHVNKYWGTGEYRLPA